MALDSDRLLDTLDLLTTYDLTYIHTYVGFVMRHFWTEASTRHIIEA